MTIMVTLQQIKDNNPCKGGWATVLTANGGTKADFNKSFPVSSIIDSNDLDDAFWTLRCLPEYNLLWRKFAWWCATSVVHLTTDVRVAECLEVVSRYCEGLATDEELEVARARAVDAAAWSERAADAAWSATAGATAEARAVARAAASAAADAAAESVWLAASAARAGSARVEVRTKQIDKLRQILDASKWVD